MKILHVIPKILVIALLLSATCLDAVTSITSPSQFYDKINRSDLVITHFYYKDKELKKNKEFMNKYRSDSSVFRATDDIQDFVRFLKVNVERAQLKELASKYGIRPTEKDTPVFVLFNMGEKIAKRSLKSGSVTIGELQDFIYDHFKDHIDKKVKELKRIRRLEREAWLLRRRYYGPYLYYGLYHAPYYYCPYHYGYHPRHFRCPYHYGGYGSFGFSFQIN